MLIVSWFSAKAATTLFISSVSKAELFRCNTTSLVSFASIRRVLCHTVITSTVTVIAYTCTAIIIKKTRSI